MGAPAAKSTAKVMGPMARALDKSGWSRIMPKWDPARKTGGMRPVQWRISRERASAMAASPTAKRSRVISTG